MLTGSRVVVEWHIGNIVVVRQARQLVCYDDALARACAAD